VIFHFDQILVIIDKVQSWLEYHNRNHDSSKTIPKKLKTRMSTSLFLGINLNLS
jgi:hypothetical protein